MKKFYGVFVKLKPPGYILVYANDYAEANRKMIDEYGLAGWAMYSQETWDNNFNASAFESVGQIGG